MKKEITFILFFTIGAVFSQTKCDRFRKNYTPKDLNDAIEYLECKWTNADQEEFKSKEEKDAVTEFHFGTGMWMRNNWGLWKGKNKLSKFFKSKGIFHPDDMSSIILTSFHRKLHNKPTVLKSQVEYYQKYWENVKRDSQIMDREQDKSSENEFDSFKINDSIKIAFKINKQGKNVWAYRIQKYPDLNEDINCYVKGVITKKKKKTRRRGNYVLTVLIMDICGNKTAIFSGEENGLNINEKYDFSLENFRITGVK